MIHGPGNSDCVFCAIIAGSEPARWVVEPGSDARGVVSFHNRLKWARIMLLVIPVAHMTQDELWGSHAIRDVASLGVDLGVRHCPEGFRLLSNFGRAAHQSQEHAHLHVVSGSSKDIETASVNGDPGTRGEVAWAGVAIEGAPWAEKVWHAGFETQLDMWSSPSIGDVAFAALERARECSPSGFRLVSDYRAGSSADGGGPPGLYVLGGGQLGLYM